jgi:hypothetical protein
MPTLEQTAKTLGLSYKQTFRRYSALKHLMPDQIDKGEDGRLVLLGGAVEALRRLEHFREKGHTLREAIVIIADEMGGNGSGNVPGKVREKGNGTAGNSEGNTLRVKVEMLERMLEEMRRDRDGWKGIAMSLEAKLALPSPKLQRRWFSWLRRKPQG